MPADGEAVADRAQAVERAPGDPDARLLLGNALLESGRAAEAVTAYGAALALRRDHAPTHYNLGNAWLALEDWAAAEASYATALALDPQHAGCLNNRGNALRRLGRPAEAAHSYRAALALWPSLHGARGNLAAALLALRAPEAAEAELRIVLRACPDDAGACNNLGGALLAQDRVDEALEWFRRAVALDPAQVQARFGVATALLAGGDLAAGFAAYEARWLDPRFRDDLRAYAVPAWRGRGTLPGRTVLLHHEQGLGDTIQFARYAPLLRARGARVVLEVQAPLVRLLAPLATEVVAAGAPLPPHDLCCPLASLPHVLATAFATIPGAVPYLAHPRPVRILRRPGLNVALTLHGSPDHPEDALRSIPAALARPLLGIAGVTVHVIHTHPRPGDRALTGPQVVTYGAELADFLDTAALIAAMDGVITVDTAVAHLAGALGVPVWIMLQHAADFRWLRGREDSPWYPTARLFRQGADRRWDVPIRAVAEALRRLALASPPSAG